MKLSWSHAVLYVQNKEVMLDFYTNVLGFQVTDRGEIGDGGPEIIFMSQDPDEHHQIGMIDTRKEDGPSNSVAHVAFRVGAFEDVRNLNHTLEKVDGINIMPLSHGNTLSIYFNDPEGNGIEVFWDTPWHVSQPQGKPWDVSMNEQQALEWVKAAFQDESNFGPRQDYHDKRRAELNA